MKLFIVWALWFILMASCDNTNRLTRIESKVDFLVVHYAQVILPEYKKYLDSDKELDDDTRRIRKRTADEAIDCIDNALNG